jgi:hypothetical protein
MPIRTILGGAALALIITAASAEEDIDSANSIMPGCRALLGPKALDDPFRQGVCEGIISEIAFVGRAILIRPDPEKSRFGGILRQILCLDIPAGVTGGQRARVVVSYIDARPARMHEDFRSLALEALRYAWPCK